MARYNVTVYVEVDADSEQEAQSLVQEFLDETSSLTLRMATVEDAQELED